MAFYPIPSKHYLGSTHKICDADSVLTFLEAIALMDEQQIHRESLSHYAKSNMIPESSINRAFSILAEYLFERWDHLDMPAMAFEYLVLDFSWSSVVRRNDLGILQRVAGIAEFDGQDLVERGIIQRNAKALLGDYILRLK